MRWALLNGRGTTENGRATGVADGADTVGSARELAGSYDTDSRCVMRPRPNISSPEIHQGVTALGDQSVSKQLASQRERNSTIRDRAARSAAAARLAGAAIGANVPLTIVPHQRRPIVPLPDEVRDTFLTRLVGRIHATFVANVSVPDDAPDELLAAPHVAAIMMHGCTLCRGTCCTRGGDHAFLGVDSLARVRRDAPALSEDELHATYVSHVPSHHVEHSCVYHGEAGCTLPRAFRSNTCNRYLCGGLTQLARALRDSGSTVAVIGMSDNQDLLDLALVSETTTTPLDFRLNEHETLAERHE